MNHYRLFVRIVIEDDDLEQAARVIWADDEVATVAGDDSNRVAETVVYLLVADTVFARAVRDMHSDKATLSDGPRREDAALGLDA